MWDQGLGGDYPLLLRPNNRETQSMVFSPSSFSLWLRPELNPPATFLKNSEYFKSKLSWWEN